MTIAYHQLRVMAARAYSDLEQHKPDLLQGFAPLYSHYKNPAHLHAVCMFLLCQDTPAAIERIATAREIGAYTARLALIAALENGPDVWHKNSEHFYEQGFLYINGKYHLVSEAFRKGRSYDTARRQLTGPALIILDSISERAFTNKSRSDGFIIGPVVLQYTAMMLMPEGPEKNFRLSALATDRAAMVHQKFLFESSQAIRFFARDLGIDTSSLGIVLRDKSPERKPMREASSLTRAQQLKPAHALANLSLLTQEPERPFDKKVLREDLQKLIHVQQITDHEARIYFYLTIPHKGHWRTYGEAARRYDMSAISIELVEKNVRRALESMSAVRQQDENSSSDTDFHQPRAIRP